MVTIVVKNWPSQDDASCTSNRETPPLHILPEPIRSTLRSPLAPKMHLHQQFRCSVPLFRRLQLRTRQPRQQIIPDFRGLLRIQIFPHVHNVSHPSGWVVMNRGRFSCMQSQQSSACNCGRCNKSTCADRAVTKITHVQSAPMNTDQKHKYTSSNEREDIRILLLPAKPNTKTLTNNSCNSCNQWILLL